MAQDTFSKLAPFLVFSYNIAALTAANVAGKYGLVWGCENAKTNNFVGGNPTIEPSFYIPYARDWGSYASPGSNQSLAWWQANHPDWILYKANGTTPAYLSPDPNMRLDVSYTPVLNWQISTYAQYVRAGGFTYIAADNVDLGNYAAAVGVYRSGVWTPLYTGAQNDAAYASMVSGWVTAFTTALKALNPPVKLIVNLNVGSYAFTDANVVSIVQNADAILDEGGFTNYGGGSIANTAWSDRVTFMQAVQQTYGKPYYLINTLPAGNSRQSLLYGLASYLMGKYHQASLYIIPHGASYGTEYYYNEYSLVAPLGDPVNDFFATQNVYQRDFSGGFVLVNNDGAHAHLYTFPVGQTYRDIYGAVYSGSYNMPAKSALILLYGVQRDGLIVISTNDGVAS